MAADLLFLIVMETTGIAGGGLPSASASSVGEASHNIAEKATVDAVCLFMGGRARDAREIPFRACLASPAGIRPF